MSNNTCDETTASNPYAKCGNAGCEVCYPTLELRSILQDVMDANDQLKVRGKAAYTLSEEVSDAKSDVQVLKDALIWLGSSALTGDTVGQVITRVRKKVVEALVNASSIDTLELSEDQQDKQEISVEQHNNDNDEHVDNDGDRDAGIDSSN